MKHFNYHFNECGLCYVSSIDGFLEKSFDANLFILQIYGFLDKSTVKELNFYFPSLLFAHRFIERYHRPHSYNFWCKVLKRFSMYNFENVLL